MWLPAQVVRHNRLELLKPFLERLVSKGSIDPAVHNALGKIIVDSNNNAQHFLTTNPYYDSQVRDSVILSTQKHLSKRFPQR